MNQRRNYLTAGGHAVHRVAARQKPDEDAPHKPDAVPIIERYQDVATFIHRTCVVPREDRFIIACVCGWVAISQIGPSGRASLQAQQHVLDKAEQLYKQLEGEPEDGPG